MQVTVRLFATLRQNAGWKEKQVEAAEATTVNDLLKLLEEQYPALHLTSRSLYAAVNQEYARLDQTLHNGDEVALFPPVSGGAATIICRGEAGAAIAQLSNDPCAPASPRLNRIRFSRMELPDGEQETF
ncbi:MAG: molybdopterin converting factor subunit 1 [Caldilineaceae bacterium]